MNEAAPAVGAIGRLKLYYERNEQRIAVLSFVCGFLFDILMVDRADSWEAIGQQVLYLAVILAALTQMFFEEGKPLETETLFVVKRWYYQYRSAIIHALVLPVSISDHSLFPGNPAQRLHDLLLQELLAARFVLLFGLPRVSAVGQRIRAL